MMHGPRTATRTQIAIVAILTNLMLIGGLIFSASVANLNLSAKDVGGAVMPPGMIMTRDTPAAAMRDMAAVDPRAVAATAPANARGDQPLEPRLDDGVKVFDLETSVVALDTSLRAHPSRRTPSTARCPGRAFA